jgi:hypothetical protein
MARTWRKVAAAAVGVLVVVGGINVAMAAGRDDAPATTTVRTVADDRGREAEARGRVAEGEQERGDDRGREQELRGRENEPGEDMRGGQDDGVNHDANDDGINHDANDDGPNHDANDDNSGPSRNAGPGSDDSGHGDNSGRGGSDD